MPINAKKQQVLSFVVGGEMMSKLVAANKKIEKATLNDGVSSLEFLMKELDYNK